MKILTIGATGFIGSHVASMLAQQRHDVTIFHRGTSGCSVLPGFQHFHGSRETLPAQRSKIAAFRPDVVLDVIPYTERHAREVLEACSGIADRIVALSSSDVYRNYDGFRGKATAPPDPVPLSEDAPLRETLYPYRGHDLAFDWTDDYEKLLVERVILGQADVSGTILRLPAVYGPGDPHHRVLSYLRRMDAGATGIRIGKSQSQWRWTRGYVEDVAAAVARAVTDDRARGRVYNVGEATALNERAWIEAIGAAAKWSGEVEEVTDEQLPFDFRYELATDTSRIREELSHAEPVALGEALSRTIEWDRSQVGPTDPE